MVPIKSGREGKGENLHFSREALWFQVSAAQKLAQGSAVSRAAFPQGAQGCRVSGWMPACAGRAAALPHACWIGTFNSHHCIAESLLAGQVQVVVEFTCLLPCFPGDLSCPEPALSSKVRLPQLCPRGLSLLELFWGLCIDTLRGNSSTSFHHVMSVPGLCPGETD